MRGASVIGVAGVLVAAAGSPADTPTVIYSTISTSPTSLVPGGGGIRFSTLDRPNPSQDGRRWITIGKNDTGNSAIDDVMIVGADDSAAMVIQEGVTPVDGARAATNMTSDRRCSIRNDGTWATIIDLDGATTDDRIVISGAGGPFNLLFREGGAVPAIAGVSWGASINEAQILDDGTVSVRATLAGAGVTTANDTGLLEGNGAAVIAREGSTIPGGQTGTPQAYSAFGFNSFSRSNDGSTWVAIGTLLPPAATDAVAVRNNQVLVQEGVTIPGLAAPVQVIYSRPIIGGNNDVFVAGWTTAGASETFVTRNGILLAKAGDTVGGGLPGEVWDSTIWNTTSGKGFWLYTSDGSGNYVLGGFTSAPAGQKAVIVYNNTTVLLREGDGVDVDGNGLLDDDAFYYVAPSSLTSASLGNRIDDGWLSSDGYFYKAVELRNGAGADLGDAIIRIALGAPCYANCDDSTVAPILNVGDFTCFLQRFAAGEAYANCDQSTTLPVLNVADFTCFLQQFAAGCP